MGFLIHVAVRRSIKWVEIFGKERVTTLPLLYISVFCGLGASSVCFLPLHHHEIRESGSHYLLQHLFFLSFISLNMGCRCLMTSIHSLGKWSKCIRRYIECMLFYDFEITHIFRKFGILKNVRLSAQPIL